MKKILLPILVAVGIVGSASASVLTGNLTNGLVAYYGFNGNFNDSSGNGLNLDNSAGVAFVPSFLGGNAQSLSLTAANSYASSSLNSGITGNDSRTIAFWFYAPSIQPWPTGNVVTLGPLSGTPSADATALALDDSKGGIIYFQNDYRDVNSDPIANLHEGPHFLALTYQNNLNGVNMYIDGTLVPSHPYQDGLTTLNTLAGRINVGRSDGLGFVGKIQDLGIWNTALTSSQVSQLYALQSVPEPSTYAFFGIGIGGILLAVRRKKLC